MIKMATRQVGLKIKWATQRLFRTNHLSDSDVWNAHNTMIAKIEPIMTAFCKIKKTGVPAAIANEHPMEVASKMWNGILEEMEYAIRYYALDDAYHTQKGKKFLKDYGYTDPYKEQVENLKCVFTYSIEGEDNYRMEFEPGLDEDEKYTLDGMFTYYSNEDQLDVMRERASKGLEYFQKYFFDLWD